VFGADIIAGFPTETEEMFVNSLALADDCGLTFLHVFPFSPRAGTPAARMPQLDRSEIKERASRLRSRGEQAVSSYFDSLYGREVELLIEQDGMGRTPQFAEAGIKQNIAIGQIVQARVTGHAGRRLIGEVFA
jgi:threonylcarbamoyladenosine tRNA methylthiotransferase MtaB